MPRMIEAVNDLSMTVAELTATCKPRESTIEKYLHGLVTANGGTTRKFVSPGRRNVPDRIVIWPERKAYSYATHYGTRSGQLREPQIHFIETKRPGKDATPAQAREHKRLRDFGCTVLVLNTKELINFYVEANR